MMIRFGCWRKQLLLVLRCSKVKVKESRNRPGVAKNVSGGLGSQIS